MMPCAVPILQAVYSRQGVDGDYAHHGDEDKPTTARLGYVRIVRASFHRKQGPTHLPVNVQWTSCAHPV